MGKYLLAHDLGTSGNKATLFSTEGQLIASCTYNYDVYYSNNNWAEQNPNDWWQAVIATTKTLIKNINPKDILAVSFSGQMMGCVCVDKKQEPLRNAIIWADMRATKAMLLAKSFDNVKVANIDIPGVDPGNITASQLDDVIGKAQDPVNFYLNHI